MPDVVVTGRKSPGFSRQPWENACRRGKAGKKHHARLSHLPEVSEAAACSKERLMLFPNFTKYLHTCGSYGFSHCKSQYDCTAEQVFRLL